MNDAALKQVKDALAVAKADNDKIVAEIAKTNKAIEEIR